MEKPADATHPLIEPLVKRWSPRAFSSRPVEREKLHSLWEAARWAPSSVNEQPWRFIVATQDQPQEFERIVGCLMDANAAWAKRAPVLMISFAATEFSQTGQPNPVAFHDVGAAMALLSVQAAALGLFVHQMGGIHRDKIVTEFAVPDGYKPVAAAAIGYPGDVNDLPEGYRERELAPRTRKSFTEFVFSGTFGNTSPLTEEE